LATVPSSPPTPTRHSFAGSKADVDVEDEVVGIHWYEGSSYLGSGTTLGVSFPIGDHTVTAVPFDGSSKWSQADTTVRVLPHTRGP
jgi:hypothetical protein